MRKRKPAPVPSTQTAILDDLKARRATSTARAVEPGVFWQPNAINRLNGRGFIAREGKNSWWITAAGLAESKPIPPGDRRSQTRVAAGATAQEDTHG